MAAKKSGSKKTGSNKDSAQATEARKTLVSDILQQFSLTPPDLKPTVQPSPTDIATIAAVLCAANGGSPDEKCIEAAIDLWNLSAKQLAARENQQRRKNAVQTLLFENGETQLSQKEFLKRLLPDDSIKGRAGHLAKWPRKFFSVKVASNFC